MSRFSNRVGVGPVRTAAENVAAGLILSLIESVSEPPVDPAVAANPRPAAINNATLLVHVTSSPWVHQLQFLKKEILGQLNAELTGAAEVKDLLFKIGPLNG